MSKLTYLLVPPPTPSFPLLLPLGRHPFVPYGEFILKVCIPGKKQPKVCSPLGMGWCGRICLDQSFWNHWVGHKFQLIKGASQLVYVALAEIADPAPDPWLAEDLESMSPWYWGCDGTTSRCMKLPRKSTRRTPTDAGTVDRGGSLEAGASMMF